MDTGTENERIDELLTQPHVIIVFKVDPDPEGYCQNTTLRIVAIPTMIWLVNQDYIKNYPVFVSSKTEIEILFIEDSLEQIVDLFKIQDIHDEYHNPNDLISYLEPTFTRGASGEGAEDAFGTSGVTLKEYYYDYWTDMFLQRDDVQKLGLTKKVYNSRKN